jgi:hypothetical protein
MSVSFVYITELSGTVCSVLSNEALHMFIDMFVHLFVWSGYFRWHVFYIIVVKIIYV